MRCIRSDCFRDLNFAPIVFAITGLAVTSLWALGAPAQSDEVLSAQSETGRIERLVRQLGHDKYVLREQAQEELTRIGAPAIDALNNALASDDVETVMRARYLRSAIEVDWTLDTDPPKLRLLLKDYGKKSETDRRRVIDQLGQNVGDSEIMVLCRIVRYEKSPPLSKWAAIAILDPEKKKTSWIDRKHLIDESLGGSRRAAAGWLRGSLADHDDHGALIERWKLLTKKERLLWQEASDQTNYEILQKLLFHLVHLLEIAGREQEAEPYLEQIVELQPANGESVRNLVNLLIEKRAVRVIETVGEKFQTIFKSDPLLLYALAHAKKSQGKQQESDDIVKSARQLNPDMGVNHLPVAWVLQQRGWFEWSEEEYRTVIRIDGLSRDTTVRAILLLSEMLHDQQQEKEAADIMNQLVIAIASNPNLAKLIQAMGRNPKSIRSRMYFFRASDYELQDNRDAQAEQLSLALQEDPRDADVLIALYRLPGQTNEQQETIQKNIHAAMLAFRKEITATPDSANPYNQFAWLVGNTLGETDEKLAEEAINCSHKSLEIRPGSAGYLDTLGRCYYAKGDYPSAVKYQNEAARLDPHSGLIRRQLEMFQEKLEQTKKNLSP
jgi:tetratricopeptide (TPR) repeat protein